VLTQGLAELRRDQDNLQTSSDARLTALEVQQADLTTRMHGDMTGVSAALEDLKKLDLAGMRTEVHRRGRQLDETDIIVKHMKTKACFSGIDHWKQRRHCRDMWNVCLHRDVMPWRQDFLVGRACCGNHGTMFRSRICRCNYAQLSHVFVRNQTRIVLSRRRWQSVQEVKALQGQVADVAAQVEDIVASRAKDAEIAEALRAMESDIELLKRRISGSLAAALGADGAALAGAARQDDLDVRLRSDHFVLFTAPFSD
jgi:hypothetical protein